MDSRSREWRGLRRTSLPAPRKNEGKVGRPGRVRVQSLPVPRAMQIPQTGFPAHCISSEPKPGVIDAENSRMLKSGFSPRAKEVPTVNRDEGLHGDCWKLPRSADNQVPHGGKPK